MMAGTLRSEVCKQKKCHDMDISLMIYSHRRLTYEFTSLINPASINGNTKTINSNGFEWCTIPNEFVYYYLFAVTLPYKHR